MKHQREDGHHHPFKHPSSHRVHHAVVPKQCGEESVKLRGVGVGGAPWHLGWRVGLDVPMVVAAVAAAVLHALSQGRAARDASQARSGFLASELLPWP